MTSKTVKKKTSKIRQEKWSGTPLTIKCEWRAMHYRAILANKAAEPQSETWKTLTKKDQ